METTRVLLVDDDQGDFEMIRVMLANAEHHEFKLDWVSSFDEAMDAFDRDEYEVYFLDYFLEDRTGLDLLREARSRGITAPIIMLTGRGSRAVDMEAMDLGASDYLVKGLVDPDALERAVRHALERERGNRAIQEIEERRREMGAEGQEWTTGTPVGRSAALFRALFESTRTGVALLGLDGRINAVNPSLRKMLGESPPWGEGTPFVDIIEEADRAAVSKEIEVLAGAGRDKFDAARRFRVSEDGPVVWAHTAMVLIRGADGTPDQLMAMLEELKE